jgi:hypothetical protein
MTSGELRKRLSLNDFRGVIESTVTKLLQGNYIKHCHKMTSGELLKALSQNDFRGVT